ncbi:MAG: GAF domain-containing sensor histidine kinase [Deltaproteobacteria bacterium]|nr:GAF domain-containing sensor histidine kinase [Deltaproteobacteria bacterium]
MTIQPLAAASPNARRSPRSHPARLRGNDKLWMYVRWLAVVAWCLPRFLDHSAWQSPVGIIGALGLGYCGAVHALAVHGRPLSHLVSLCGDTLLVALLCGVTGGLQSETLPYFHGVALAAAIRFGFREGLMVTGISALAIVTFFLLPSADAGSLNEPLSVIASLALVTGLSSLFAREHLPLSQLEGSTMNASDRLLALSHAMTSLDVDTILQQLAEEIPRQVPCRGVGILLLEPQRRRADRVAAAGELTIPTAPELNAALANGLLHDALEQGTVLLDTPSLIRTRLPLSPRMQEWATRNILIVRIMAEEPIGCIILTDTPNTDGFTHEDAQLLTAVAAHTALAIVKAAEVARMHANEEEHQRLLRGLIHAQEEERKQMVEEWHSRLGEKLFQVIRDFRACQELMTQRVPEGKERMDRLARELDTMSALVRDFANEIHPSVLDDFGFVEALREYVATLGDQEPFAVTLHTDNATAHLPNDAELTLFRITQEAVRNIRQHAQARNVNIAFVHEQSGVSLMIKDDGQGFNPTQSPQEGHYGLLYMRERAEACGGEFHVHSVRGQGTEIRVEFPTPPTRDARNPPRPPTEA